jgi:hypothetical protein
MPAGDLAAVMVEHLAVILFEPRLARAHPQGLGSQTVGPDSSALLPFQASADPCVCGCGERVSPGRRFVSQEHQREWMRSGGAAALISRRWKTGRSTR